MMTSILSNTGKFQSRNPVNGFGKSIAKKTLSCFQNPSIPLLLRKLFTHPRPSQEGIKKCQKTIRLNLFLLLAPAPSL